jgi:hypothetical protein
MEGPSRVSLDSIICADRLNSRNTFYKLGLGDLHCLLGSMSRLKPSDQLSVPCTRSEPKTLRESTAGPFDKSTRPSKIRSPNARPMGHQLRSYLCPRHSRLCMKRRREGIVSTSPGLATGNPKVISHRHTGPIPPQTGRCTSNSILITCCYQEHRRRPNAMITAPSRDRHFSEFQNREYRGLSVRFPQDAAGWRTSRCGHGQHGSITRVTQPQSPIPLERQKT